MISIYIASKQGFNLYLGPVGGVGHGLKHIQKVQAHSGTMCSSGKIWGDAVLAGWSMNHRTTAHLLTQCAVSKLVSYLNSANLSVNLIPRSSKDSPKYSPIILDYSRIPGYTYYSQKDTSTIYLSLLVDPHPQDQQLEKQSVMQ